jgi:serine/threonine-protein kinase
MSPSPTDRNQRIDSVFDALLDLPPDEQMGYLHRAAGDDPELHEQVLRLLHAHRRAEGFLDSPSPPMARALLEEPAPSAVGQVPDQIGPWRIARLIGEGGMGAVFLGERADGQFEQRAAIKVLHRGTPGMVRRFLEERRILALLEHPGIARLIEGGLTPGGLPYFAMELIEGTHLSRYCEAHDLPLDRRLELIDQVCDAVSYAHHHLIIHRDLKPSNILVTAAGRVKLLDFGIAKVLSGESAAHRTETRMPVMTPEFAAPEQVRGEAVSTATDVYALGVLLYLLLTGGYPYNVRNASLAELTRIVCEEQPPRPSSRAPEPLTRRLRGDLDLIVLTALQKDPARRYPSPAALAEDLGRFREGRPILARPDTAGYRLGKFVGRHRAGVAAAASVVVLLGAGVARERVLRQRAEIEARKATEVGDYLVGVFDVADPFAVERRNGQEVTARALLDQGARRVDSTLAGQPEVQAQLRTVLGRAYTSLGLYDQATRLLRQSLAQHRSLYGDDDPAVAEDMARLGDAYLQQDRFDEAEPLLRGALERRRLGGSRAAAAETMDRLATLYQRRNDYAAAEPLFREALAVRRGLFGDTAVLVAQSLNDLGVLLFQKNAYDEADSAYQEALAIDLRALGESHPLTAEVLHNRAQTQWSRGHLAQAESLFRRALAAKRTSLGAAHPSISINLNNLGMLLVDQGQLGEADSLVREALALDRRMFGENHSYVAASLRNLGTVLRLEGRLAEAEQRLREALAIDRAVLGPAHGQIALDLNSLGNILRAQRDTPGAVAALREAFDMGRRTLGDDRVNTIAFSINLGRALQEGGTAEEAEVLLRQAVGRLDTTRADHRQWYVNARSGLGLALVAEGRAAEATDLLGPTVEFARRYLGETHLRTTDARLALGRALLASHQYARAEPLLKTAAAAFDAQRKAQPYFADEAAAALAELRRRRGE